MRLFILIGSGCLDLAPFMFRVVGGVFELSLGHFKPKFISSKAHYHIIPRQLHVTCDKEAFT